MSSADFLTHADGSDDRGGDDGQGHAPRDGQVPPVARGLLQLVVGVDLQQGREKFACRVVTIGHNSMALCAVSIYS